jgi:TonB family protein
MWNQSAWFSILVATALKSAAVLAAAWLGAAVLRNRSAASRHLVWTAAFAALLALPFLAISLPPLRVASPLPLPNVVFQTTATSTATADPSETRALHTLGVALPVQPAPRRLDLSFWLMAIWMVGAAAAFLQMLVAMISIARVRRNARAFLDSDAEALSEAVGLRHSVELLETSRGSMPMTFGLLRPAVFMPSDAAAWTAERRRVVLLHELAHVRRGDVVTHLLARTAMSFYWWNPLAWTAWRSFLKERERATDDLVLSAGARASEYAGHLLEVAQQMQSSGAIGWAAVAMARPSQLEGRLLAILDARVNRKAPGRIAAALAALLAVAIVAPLAAVQSQDPAAQSIPADVDATIRAANAQKNHDLLENAAKAATTMKQYDVAQKLLESAVAIRQQVSGDRSSEYAVGLIKLGDLERTRNHPAEAQAFYEKAVGILGNGPDAAPAYMHLGLLAIGKKDFDGAIARFQQAQVADPAKAGSAMMWMGIVRQRQGDFTEAESMFRGALAVQDEKTTEAATTMSLYSNLLKQINRPDEAASLQARVTALRQTSRPQGKPLEANVFSASGPYRVGGGVTAPMLLYKKEPEYSEEARAAKYQGTVTLYVEVGPDGSAHNMRVVNGIGLGLDEKAMDAVSQWKFKPGTKDGAPVTTIANIEVNFRLL